MTTTTTTNMADQRLALARALGFGCVAAMENPHFGARLMAHSQAYAEAVANDDATAVRDSFATLETPAPATDPALDLARAYAAPLFVEGVRLALAHPEIEAPAPIKTLEAFAWTHHTALGFCCQHDAFAAIAPRAEHLTLEAVSRETRRYRGFDVTVSVEPFWSMSYVHLQFQSPDRSPLPFTETGYRSHFVAFAELAQWADLDAYLASWFPASEAEQAGQLGLFA